jgi:hypothetical protein
LRIWRCTDVDPALWAGLRAVLEVFEALEEVSGKIRPAKVKELTQAANFDNLEKFAQNTAARPVKSKKQPNGGFPETSSVNTAPYKFEDTSCGYPQCWSLIQNCPLRRVQSGSLTT